MENEEDLSMLMMNDRAFSVRSIYLQPRELVPFPGTEFYPSYDYDSHPKYPIPLTESGKEIFSGYVPVVENSSGSSSPSASSPTSSSNIPTKIQFKVPPANNDVARFETVASEPLVPLVPLFQASSTSQTKLVIPPPVTRPFYHSHDGFTDKSNQVVQRYFMQSLYSENNENEVVKQQVQEGQEGQMLILPNTSPVVYNQPEETLELPSLGIKAAGVPNNNSASHLFSDHHQHDMPFHQNTGHSRKPMMGHQSLYLQYSLDKNAMNRSVEKILPTVTSDVVPSPTSSSLGLSQIKALYEERHKKSARGSKKKNMYSNNTNDTSGYAPTMMKYHRPQATKKARTIFSDSQSADMLRVFRQTPYISAKQRSQMAQHLEIPEETISVWFKNQRSKMKKKMSLYLGSTATSVVDS